MRVPTTLRRVEKRARVVPSGRANDDRLKRTTVLFALASYFLETMTYTVKFLTRISRCVFILYISTHPRYSLDLL